MRIRRYEESDWDEALRMYFALFPGSQLADGEEDVRAYLSREDGIVLVLERPEGGLAGFVEARPRSVADGCRTSPVGYIEAWYVDPDIRRGGHGRALLAAAEDWARGQGYTEMASDALIDNSVSHEAHVHSGYEVVDRVVEFRKDLYPERK